MTTSILDSDVADLTESMKARGWRIADGLNPGARRQENHGRIWLVVSYILCPCHLPVSLAVVGSLIGGTAVGAAIAANSWTFGLVLAALYGAALWKAFVHLRRAKAAVSDEDQGSCSTGQCRI